MIVTAGDKVRIITRRSFEGDLRRHFAGVVDEVSATLIRTTVTLTITEFGGRR